MCFFLGVEIAFGFWPSVGAQIYLPVDIDASLYVSFTLSALLASLIWGLSYLSFSFWSYFNSYPCCNSLSPYGVCQFFSLYIFDESSNETWLFISLIYFGFVPFYTGVCFHACLSLILLFTLFVWKWRVITAGGVHVKIISIIFKVNSNISGHMLEMETFMQQLIALD